MAKCDRGLRQGTVLHVSHSCAANDSGATREGTVLMDIWTYGHMDSATRKEPSPTVAINKLLTQARLRLTIENIIK
jgi:hypothetical protein